MKPRFTTKSNTMTKEDSEYLCPRCLKGSVFYKYRKTKKSVKIKQTKCNFCEKHVQITAGTTTLFRKQK